MPTAARQRGTGGRTTDRRAGDRAARCRRRAYLEIKVDDTTPEHKESVVIEQLANSAQCGRRSMPRRRAVVNAASPGISTSSDERSNQTLRRAESSQIAEQVGNLEREQPRDRIEHPGMSALKRINQSGSAVALISRQSTSISNMPMAAPAITSLGQWYPR